MPPRAVCLMGPPGAGKSRMIAYTAVNRPVHFIDVDHKVQSCGLDLPDVTFWEIGEPLAEDLLANRLEALVKGQAPKNPPMGWPKFALMGDNLTKRKESMVAGTWAIDSWTRLIDHLKRQILYLDKSGRANLSLPNFGALQGMQEETLSQLIDLAKANGKDLIVTVHEQTSEQPGPQTKVTYTRDVKGGSERELEGEVNVKITPSIDGNFRFKMMSYFDEAYALFVEVVNGKPRWQCRVLPDGRRDLRTALPVDRAVYPPDFREIWGPTVPKAGKTTIEPGKITVVNMTKEGLRDA